MLRDILKLSELHFLAGKKKKQMSKPKLIDLFWECTMTCNAKCKHCGSSAENKKYSNELTTDEIKNAFLQISKDMNAKKILIMVTGGEPLTRQDLCEVMAYAKDLGFHWGLVTNGILLTEQNIEKLKEAGMETISISIDGIGETHNSFRGVNGCYETIVRNIENLKNANYVKHLQVTTIFHKENFNELEKVYSVMCGLGLDSWRIGTIDPIGRGRENDNLLLDGIEIKYILDFIKVKNKEKKLRITYYCHGFLGLAYEKEVRGHYFNCRTGMDIASILYNGDIFVCPNVPRIPELIQGNVRSDNFADVWKNKFKQFRNKQRTSCDYCNSCEHWKYCLGGAMHTWDFEKNVQNKCPYDIISNG